MPAEIPDRLPKEMPSAEKVKEPSPKPSEGADNERKQAEEKLAAARDTYVNSPANVGKVIANLEKMKAGSGWIWDSAEAEEARTALPVLVRQAKGNLEELKNALDAASDKGTAGYRQLRAKYVEDSARLTELLANADAYENADVRDADAAAKQAQETIQHMSTDEAIDWVQRTLSAIDGNNWQSSGLKECYGKMTIAFKQSLQKKLAEEKTALLTDPSKASAYAEHCMMLAKLFTDRGTPIDADLTDIDFAVSMAKDALGFDELALRYVENSLQEKNPLREAIAARKTGVLQSLRTKVSPETLKSPQVQSMMRTIEGSPLSIQGLADQYRVLRQVEAQLNGQPEPNYQEELNEKLARPLEASLEKFDTFLDGTWRGAVSLENINASIGHPPLTSHQMEAWKLLSDIRGYGWDIGDKAWSNIAAGAKIGAMIVAGVAIGAVTAGAGLGVISAALAGGAAMTATNAAINQEGFDGLSDAANVYGKDFAVNAATMGAARYLSAGRAAYQLSRAGLLKEAGGVKELFKIAGQKGGMKLINSFDDGLNIGTRLTGATLEGTADTLIGTTLDTAVQVGSAEKFDATVVGGMFLDNLKSNAIFMGLGYSEFGGGAAKGIWGKLRHLPAEELHGIHQTVNRANLLKTELEGLCHGTGIDPKVAVGGVNIDEQLKKLPPEQATKIRSAGESLRKEKSQFAYTFDVLTGKDEWTPGRVVQVERLGGSKEEGWSVIRREPDGRYLVSRGEKGKVETKFVTGEMLKEWNPEGAKTPAAAPQTTSEEEQNKEKKTEAKSSLETPHAVAVEYAKAKDITKLKNYLKTHDMDDATRVSLAENLLGHPLSGPQKTAVSKAHGIDGEIDNLTPEQKTAKGLALMRKDVFTRDEAQALLDAGICGAPPPPPPPSRKLRQLEAAPAARPKFGWKSGDTVVIDRAFTSSVNGRPVAQGTYRLEFDSATGWNLVESSAGGLRYHRIQAQDIPPKPPAAPPPPLRGLSPKSGQSPSPQASAPSRAPAHHPGRTKPFSEGETVSVNTMPGVQGGLYDIVKVEGNALILRLQGTRQEIRGTAENLRGLLDSGNARRVTQQSSAPSSGKTTALPPEHTSATPQSSSGPERRSAPDQKQTPKPAESAGITPALHDRVRQACAIANDSTSSMAPTLQNMLLSAIPDADVRIHTNVMKDDVPAGFKAGRGADYYGFTTFGNAKAGKVFSPPKEAAMFQATKFAHDLPSSGKVPFESVVLGDIQPDGSRSIRYTFAGGSGEVSPVHGRQYGPFHVMVSLDAPRAQQLFGELEKHPENARAFFAAASQDVENAGKLWGKYRPPYERVDATRRLLFAETHTTSSDTSGPAFRWGLYSSQGGEWRPCQNVQEWIPDAGQTRRTSTFAQDLQTKLQEMESNAARSRQRQREHGKIAGDASPPATAPVAPSKQNAPGAQPSALPKSPTTPESPLSFSTGQTVSLGTGPGVQGGRYDIVGIEGNTLLLRLQDGTGQQRIPIERFRRLLEAGRAKLGGDPLAPPAASVIPASTPSSAPASVPVAPLPTDPGKLTRLPKEPPPPPSSRKNARSPESQTQPSSTTTTSRQNASQERQRPPTYSPSEYPHITPKTLQQMQRAAEIAATPRARLTPALASELDRIVQHENVYMNKAVDKEDGSMYQGFEVFGNENAQKMHGRTLAQTKDWAAGSTSREIHTLLKDATSGFENCPLESITLSDNPTRGKYVVEYAYVAPSRVWSKVLDGRPEGTTTIGILLEAKDAERLYETLRHNPELARTFFVAAAQDVNRGQYIWGKIRPSYDVAQDKLKLVFAREQLKSGATGPALEVTMLKQTDHGLEICPTVKDLVSEAEENKSIIDSSEKRLETARNAANIRQRMNNRRKK